MSQTLQTQGFRTHLLAVEEACLKMAERQANDLAVTWFLIVAHHQVKHFSGDILKPS